LLYLVNGTCKDPHFNIYTRIIHCHTTHFYKQTMSLSIAALKQQLKDMLDHKHVLPRE